VGEEWKIIDRYQIHEVHQEDPDEYGHRQGGNEVVLAVERTFYVVIDEIHDPLDEVLQAAWNPGRSTNRRLVEKIGEHEPESDTPTEGIQMEGPEAHITGLLGATGNPPGAIRLLAKGQMLQMVLDILSRSEGFRGHCFFSYPYFFRQLNTETIAGTS
jgi:hypothetical protein